MLKLSNVFERNVEAWADEKIRYIINQGGTSSTKTFSILQVLVTCCLKHNLHIDIAGLNVPHLKSGVLNDMPMVCEQFGFDFDSHYSSTDRCFRNGAGRINFIAIDKIGKAHGGRRDILYLNEANHLPFPIAEQLMIRTRKKVLIDYNPTNAFWVHTQILKDEPEKSRLIKSTYKDNPWLETSIIKSIESKRGDGNNNFWRVYGMGELGVAEGLVFNNFEQLDFDINRFSQYRNGVDWGFSSDPFAFVRVAIENDCLYICREIYQRDLLNNQSAPLVRGITNRTIIRPSNGEPMEIKEIVRCDSAEPKSIKEFQTLGINAISVKKGPGSIESGIKFLQGFKKIFVHPSCPNLYSEFCNYQWKKDKTGTQMPEPIDAFNHGIDGIRYALEDDMSFRSKSKALDF
jgi:phage terminase large subunit